MIRGLYTSTTGMLANEIRMDDVANNLANVNTTGYKGDVEAMKSFPQMLVHRINDTYLKVSGIEGEMDLRPLIGMSTFGVVVDEIATDHAQGEIYVTGRNFDLAIDGRGFFTLQTPFGERLTRDGEFSMNASHELVNSLGYRVMGETGPVVLKGKKFVVDEKGAVFNGEKGDEFVDRLKIVTVDDLRTVRKRGHNMFEVGPEHPQPRPADDFALRQGAVEKSNVNAISMLRDMVQIMRTYEANQRVILTEDQELGRAVNDIARL
ncbi:MAG: flagellar basal-body rod protein FlgF [bacterium]